MCFRRATECERHKARRPILPSLKRDVVSANEDDVIILGLFTRHSNRSRDMKTGRLFSHHNRFFFRQCFSPSSLYLYPHHPTKALRD